MAVGQSKVFSFDHSFREIKMPGEGIVQALAQNDRQLSLTGLAPGQTPIFVYAPTGELLYSATLTVGQEPGHMSGCMMGEAGTIPDFIVTRCSAAGPTRS